jgi:translation initiation factor IF-1
MVKNTFGGFKGKTFARKLSKPSSSLVRLPQDDLELFGCVSKLLGNGRVIVHLLDGKDIQCVIRNKFRGRSKRNNLITIGSFVLIGLHDWEAPNFKNADILNVYSYDDVIYLKSLPNLNLSSLDSFLYNLNPSSSLGSDIVSFSNDSPIDDNTPIDKVDIMDKVDIIDKVDFAFDDI